MNRRDFQDSRRRFGRGVARAVADAALHTSVTAAPDLDPADERVQPGQSLLYWQVRREVGIKSPFSTLSAKARFKSSTTNRNLRTLLKILAVPTAG